jgi:hypothetical protein
MSLELTIPPVVQKAFAVALLALPILALVAMIWGFMSDALQHRERVALLEREKTAYEAVLRARPEWDRQRAGLHRSIVGEKVFYTGKTVDGDAKKMEEHIAALLASTGATAMQDSVTIGTSSADGPTQIHDMVNFSGTMGQLRTALYKLKQSRPLLFAERLTIRGADPGSFGRLRIEMQIFGFSSPS